LNWATKEKKEAVSDLDTDPSSVYILLSYRITGPASYNKYHKNIYRMQEVAREEKL
jgi:hypothetical protein